MRTPNVWINGLGSFVPETESIESALQRGLCTESEAKEHQMTGAAVAGSVSAPEMAVRAARTAMADAGIETASVRLLLYADTWHQGPEGWFPQYYVQRELGLREANALEVRQGCNGMLNAIDIAAPYVMHGEEDAAALLVASDNFGTPRMDRWRSGGFVFGDGAGAMVLTRRPGPVRLLSAGVVSVPELEELHREGEPLFPPGATLGGTLDLRSRFERFEKRMDGRRDEVFVWLKLQMAMITLVRRIISEAGIDTDGIAKVALISLGPGALEHQWLEMLNLPPEKSTWEFGRSIGHLGASDPVIGLEHLIAEGEVGPGDHVLLGGIGSGVTVSCAVVRIEEETSG